MKRVLLVDDEEFILKALRRLLSLQIEPGPDSSCRFKMDIFTEPEAALEKARHTAYDLVISDYRMPRMDGVEFLSRFRALQPTAIRIILSGHADLAGLIGAINRAGINRFISKPWNDKELVSILDEELQGRDEALETAALAEQLRLAQGTVTAEEYERRRLEALEPGITHVNWGPDGSVLLDESLLDAPPVFKDKAD